MAMKILIVLALLALTGCATHPACERTESPMRCSATMNIPSKYQGQASNGDPWRYEKKTMTVYQWGVSTGMTIK